MGSVGGSFNNQVADMLGLPHLYPDNGFDPGFGAMNNNMAPGFSPSGGSFNNQVADMLGLPHLYPDAGMMGPVPPVNAWGGDPYGMSPGYGNMPAAPYGTGYGLPYGNPYGNSYGEPYGSGYPPAYGGGMQQPPMQQMNLGNGQMMQQSGYGGYGQGPTQTMNMPTPSMSMPMPQMRPPMVMPMPVYPQSNGAGSKAVTPLGIYITSVGPLGGNAHAGFLGAQAAGQGSAMVLNPINPGMIVDFASPNYSSFNFNQGFFQG